jgi:hypothetical protein
VSARRAKRDRRRAGALPFVDLVWPAFGEAQVVFSSNGRSAFVGLCSPELSQAQRAALRVAERWGCDPTRPPPPGWALYDLADAVAAD